MREKKNNYNDNLCMLHLTNVADGKYFQCKKKCRNILYVKCRCYYLEHFHGVNVTLASAFHGEALSEGCMCLRGFLSFPFLFFLSPPFPQIFHHCHGVVGGGG